MDQKLTRIMPESAGPVLALEINQPVTLEFYNELYLPALRKIFAAHQEVRVLFYYPEPSRFPGWEEAAAELDLRMKNEHGHHARKIALVNAPESATSRWTLSKSLIDGEVKIYPKDQLQDALRWIKS